MSIEVGTFLRDARRRAKLTQKAVARLLDVTGQYISLVETGERNPPLDDVQRWSDAYQIAVDDLRRLLASPAPTASLSVVQPPPPPALRIGFVHNLWAAPVILLLDKVRDPLPSVILTSYGEVSTDSNTPFPYDLRSLRNERHIKAGPQFVNCGSPALDWMRPWEKNDHLRPYTVADLVALMGQTPPALDAIVGAFQPAEDLDRDLSPCARVMYAFGGCSLLLAGRVDRFKPCKQVPAPGAELDRDTWQNVVRKAAIDLPVLYARGTVAEKHLGLLVGNPPAPKLLPVEVDLGDWGGVVKAVDEYLKENSPGLCALLAWEPQISWLDAKLQEWQTTRPEITWYRAQRTRQILPDGANLPYVSFDVIARNDVLKVSQMREGLEDFIDHLGSVAANLSKNKGGPGSYEVRLVARYLSMNAGRCSEALSDLEFFVLYHPEWVKRRFGNGH